MGQSPPGSTYNENRVGLPFYQGAADFGPRFPTRRVWCSAPSRIAEAGDILLSIRAPIGDVNLASEKCAVGRGLAIVRARRKEDQTFVEFALRAARYDWESMEGSGTVFANATRSQLERLAIPWFNAESRQAIAHILSSLDDKIELNRRMNQTLEDICRALFKFWFVNFGPVRAKQEGRWKKGESLPGMPANMWDLWPSEFEESEIGEIPKGWKVRPVSSIVEVNPERRLAKGEVARYVEMGQLSTSSARVGGWLDRAYTSGSRFQNGDVLVARITPCLENGKTAYVDFLKGSKIGWGSTELLVLSARKPLPPQWTYCLARTDHFRMHLVQNMTGTSGRQRAPAECLDSLVVAIPMNEITQRFGQFVTPWFEKFKANDEESSTLAGARDALLPKLLSGEIRVPVNGGK